MGSDKNTIAAAQPAIAAEPAPAPPPLGRDPAPVVVVDEGALVLVETRKNLSQGSRASRLDHHLLTSARTPPATSGAAFFSMESSGSASRVVTHPAWCSTSLTLAPMKTRKLRQISQRESQPPLTLRVRTLAVLISGFIPFLIQADCSRVLQVPVAPIGLAVTVKDGDIGGIYPDLLRSESTRTGCVVEFQVVPRARQELLFETGQSDLLIPARRSARRDAHGIFVPMIRSRAALVSLRSRQLPAANVTALLSHRELRVAVVRGYDYDGSYQALVKQLRTEGRLIEPSDPVSLARALDAGIADVAVITPTAVTGALRSDPKLSTWIDRLHVAPAPELPWGESDAYVSRSSSLNDADRKQAVQMLERIARSGQAWRAFQRYHPGEDLGESLGPR